MQQQQQQHTILEQQRQLQRGLSSPSNTRDTCSSSVDQTRLHYYHHPPFYNLLSPFKGTQAHGHICSSIHTMPYPIVRLDYFSAAFTFVKAVQCKATIKNIAQRMKSSKSQLNLYLLLANWLYHLHSPFAQHTVVLYCHKQALTVGQQLQCCQKLQCQSK